MCNAENSCHTMFLFCYHDSNYQYFEENDCALTQQKDNGKVCFLHQSRKPHCVPKCNYFLWCLGKVILHQKQNSSSAGEKKLIQKGTMQRYSSFRTLPLQIPVKRSKNLRKKKVSIFLRFKSVSQNIKPLCQIGDKCLFWLHFSLCFY